jgi:hypothetical protein
MGNDIAALMELLPADKSRQHLQSVCIEGVWFHGFTLPPALRVFVSLETHDDGRRWIHASASLIGKATRQAPKWKHLCRVRKSFFAPDAEVLQVFPPVTEYVNAAEALHFWSCRDERLVGP